MRLFDRGNTGMAIEPTFEVIKSVPRKSFKNEMPSIIGDEQLVLTVIRIKSFSSITR